MEGFKVGNNGDRNRFKVKIFADGKQDNNSVGLGK
jgi:hypothetical protein